MKPVSTVRVLAALVTDTFRQSLSSRIFYLMIGISLVCILFCFSVTVTGATTLIGEDNYRDFLTKEEAAKRAKEGHKEGERIDGSDVISGNLSLAFGLIKVPLGRDATDSVKYLLMLLAGPIADTAGIVLTLIWTAGFLPGFLEPSAVSVLLAKPVSRGTLLVGKYIGVLLFVFVQSVIFILGTWFALGTRTGIWIDEYLWCIPILLVHFGIFYSFSMFLAVASRSTVVCVLGSILFWFLCWGMNSGRHSALAETLGRPDKLDTEKLVAANEAMAKEQVKKDQAKSPPKEGIMTKEAQKKKEDESKEKSEPKPVAPSQPKMEAKRFNFAVEAGYWILPKPLDMADMLFTSLGAEKYFPPLASAKIVREQGKLSPTWSILSSLVFTVLVLWGATYEFKVVDY